MRGVVGIFQWEGCVCVCVCVGGGGGKGVTMCKTQRYYHVL